MTKFPNAPKDRTHAGEMLLYFLLALGLANAFGGAAVVVPPPTKNPVELIEAGLPPGETIKTARKPQFLAALSAAVNDHRNVAPAITKTAVAVHRDYAVDIVVTVVRSTKQYPRLTGAVVAAAISVAPDQAVAIEDAAIGAAPDCADAIEGASEDIPAEGPVDLEFPPVVQPPLPGSLGGGSGFDTEEAKVLICDNGRPRTIRATRLNQFLASHPGAFPGSCQVTPATSR